MRIDFATDKWLFGMRLNFRLDAGRWVGRGTVDLNVSRLLAGMGAMRTPQDSFSIQSTDLLRNFVDFNPASTTLDGNDNFVSDRLIPQAINFDWPRYVRDYVAAIRETVITTIGPASDFTRSCRTDWLLHLPPPDQWSLTQAEVYCELRDPNALLRVNEMSATASSLAARFSERLHAGSAVTASNQRQSNMPSLSFDLGAENVSLTIYAKAHQRLRVEVRYTKSPLRSCGLRKSRYYGLHGVTLLMGDVRADAHRRLVAFFRACQGQFSAQAPTLAVLGSLLSFVAVACDNDAVLVSQVLAILINRGGLSANGHREMPQVIGALERFDVIQPTRAGLRRRREDYVLTGQYSSTVRALRPLAEAH